MIMEAITCPHCGGDLNEFRNNAIQICPYCGRPVYANDEGGHFTYTKVFVKEDKARMKEAEVEENLRSQEMAFEREKYFDQQSREDRREEKAERANKTKIRLIVAFVLVCLFLGQHLFMNLQAERREQLAYQQALADQNTPKEVVHQSENLIVSKSTLQAAISSANELVTFKYFYTNLGESEKDKKLFNSIKIPFTTKKTIFTYDGVISAGYSLGSVEIGVNDAKKEISVKLPKPRILSHTIDMDSFQTYDVKKSIFTSIEIEEYTDFINALKKSQEEKLKEKVEFWDQTRSNAESTIKEILTATGATADYTITFE